MIDARLTNTARSRFGPRETPEYRVVTVVGNEGALHPLSDAIVQAQCEMTVCSTCYTFDAAGNYGAQTTVAQKTMSVEDAAEHILNNLIELTDRSGWENGDGGSGEAYFDLQTGKLLSFVHTVYYTESDTTEYEPDELFGVEEAATAGAEQ